MSNRLAIDIGGTFTDVVLERGDQLFAVKVLTTHAQPADAVMQGIAKLMLDHEVSTDSIDLVLHGTTLATNAIIERRGARTALLTTEGHRDVLAMAFENRFEQYDINIERPEPLVPRRLRLPIRERMNGSGSVLRALSLASVDEAINVIKGDDVESIAIGFLHSYANSDHEERVAEKVAAALPNVSISLSSQVCPEIREYERFSTTCANAYVLPLMATYLNDLAARLQGFGCKCPLMVMTSNGGLTTLEAAVKFPIRLVESGPAGGAMLAARKAKEHNLVQAVSFDMGGTTAKICLIDNGQPLRSRAFEVDRSYRFKKGSGLPVRIPVIEMVEIGAGGGSIASVDQLQRTRVGPRSAGSKPGPACYGLGGSEPTVTDADAVLGRLEVSRFAGGQLALDIEIAEQALNNQFQAESGNVEFSAARAISEVVDENMASAARSHASEWGKAVAGRSLIAYGGAAPLHAARLLDKLHCDHVLIPQGAGVGSAIGFLHSPIAFEVVRSHYLKLSNYQPEIAEEILGNMREEAEAVLAGVVSSVELTQTATAYMRYVGQGYEISVPIDRTDLSLEALRKRYEDAYLALYGRLLPKSDIEVMSWTLTLASATADPQPWEAKETARPFDGELRSQRIVELDRVSAGTCVDREDLVAGDCLQGPVLITEEHTTTYVPSAFELTVHQSGDLLLRRCEA